MDQGGRRAGAPTRSRRRARCPLRPTPLSNSTSLDLIEEGPEALALGPRVCLTLQDAPALFLFAPGLLGESPPALDLSASRLLSLALLLPCPLRVGDDDEPDDDMIELRLYRVRRSGCPGRPDLRHSDEESRFLRLGRAATGRVLIVAYTVRRRDHGERIRIISARRASRKERAADAAASRD